MRFVSHFAAFVCVLANSMEAEAEGKVPAEVVRAVFAPVSYTHLTLPTILLV